VIGQCKRGKDGLFVSASGVGAKVGVAGRLWTAVGARGLVIGEEKTRPNIAPLNRRGMA
jgi:hypothetical protein